jgi:starch synthase
MKIVHAASEFSPLVRVGHLADAVGGLSRELARQGHQVAVFLPGYRQVLADPRVAAAETFYKHTLELGDALVTAETLRVPWSENLTLYLVRRDESFDRSFPYGPPGCDYEDSETRFLIFCKAVVDAMCRFEAPVDVLHCHDWPMALIPLLLRVEERKRNLSVTSRTVLTLHNPSFQGVYPRRTFAQTNLPEEFFAQDGLEFYGQVNFLKGGMLFSDFLLTPSPTSAREMLGPELGFGLDGVLARRQGDLRGLLTGLDEEEWSPAADPLLPAAFDAVDPAGKARCRDALCKGLGFASTQEIGAIVAAQMPLLSAHGLGDPAAWLPVLREDTVLVLLGPLAPADVAPWRALAGARPGRVVLLENPEAGPLHRILGGADFFLGLARVEPSPHLAQRALCYGAIPVMPRTGGAADVIMDIDEQPDAGTGILFEPTVDGCGAGLARALVLHEQRERCENVRQRGLVVDSRWLRHAPAYADLYRQLA